MTVISWRLEDGNVDRYAVRQIELLLPMSPQCIKFWSKEKERSVIDAILAELKESNFENVLVPQSSQVISPASKEEKNNLSIIFLRFTQAGRESHKHANGVSSIEPNAIRPATFL